MANSFMLTVTLPIFWLFFLLENDRFIFNLKLFASTFGCGRAQSSQTIESFLRNPWLAKLIEKLSAPIAYFYVLENVFWGVI
jgi:hypothetical protein